MAEGYKEKLNQPLLTDAGRQIFLQVGNGDGKLVYTRATLSSRKPVDLTGKALDDEAIRQITSLPDDLKEGQLQLTPVQNDHFDVVVLSQNIFNVICSDKPGSTGYKICLHLMNEKLIMNIKYLVP